MDRRVREPEPTRDQSPDRQERQRQDLQREQEYNMLKAQFEAKYRADRRAYSVNVGILCAEIVTIQ